MEITGKIQERSWVILGVLCLSLLMVTLDNTVLNVALPTLMRDLGATSTQLQWIVDAYVLVFAGLLLVAGSLADRIGRKKVLIIGLAAFAMGSAWAAYSGSVGMLIAARASMGIGGAAITPSTLAIITDYFKNTEQRRRAFGFWAATSGAGVALGPIVGGLLLVHFWWGSVFLINLPIAIIAIIGGLILVPESRDSKASHPDLLGSLLSIVGIGLLLWAIIEAPVQGWTTTLVIGTGLGGLAILGSFIFWEFKSKHPMLKLAIFSNRSFSGAIFSVSLVMFGLFGVLFVLTQYLQFDLGYTALQTGIRVIPAAGAIILIAPLSSILERKIGTKFIIAAGLLIVALGLYEISGVTVLTTYSGVLAGMIMLGVGAGLVIPAATAAVMGALPTRHIGIGSATNGAFLQIGGALGVAVIGSLLFTQYLQKMTSNIAVYHLPNGVEKVILGSIGGALSVAGHLGGEVGLLLTALAKQAFINGMDQGLFVGAIVALAGALIAFFVLPKKKLEKKTKK